jgi:hypothetical protein
VKREEPKGFHPVSSRLGFHSVLPELEVWWECIWEGASAQGRTRLSPGDRGS